MELLGDPYRFVTLHLVWVVAGMAGFLGFYFLPYQKLKTLSLVLFVVVLVFLGILAVVGILPCSFNVPFAPCLNGANRWIYFNPPPLPKIPLVGILGFQPSELAKLALILYVASILSKFLDSRPIKSKSTGSGDFTLFLTYIIPTAAFAGLIVLQPSMSTAVLVFAIGTAIFFAAGGKIKYLIRLVPLAVLLGGLVMVASPYRRARILTLVKPDRVEENERTTGYHSKQVLIALGSGGVFGVGLGQSKQKFQYLPEVSSDSIFAIIGEELGFIGTAGVIIIFLLLIYKGLETAKNAPDTYGRLLAVGIVSWIGFQFFINVAAMSKLIPLTGMPIPFISYGGSATIFSLIGLGILAGVARRSG